MAYQLSIREKAVENKLRKDYFQAYNAEDVLGDIDFAVAVPVCGPQLFEPEYLLWAEAKKSNHNDIYESFVQLILTVGKARTFDKHLPPAFLGAFDAEKMAFIPYNSVLDIFYQNDFNWNVPPSNHETKEFRQVYETVKDTLDRELLLFYFDKDDKELRSFIMKNFVFGKSKVSKVRIGKNNFTAIYQKWLAEVKPTIANVNWETAKKKGIIDADFYLADILSEHNVTLREKLYVLLRKDYYELDRKIDDTGFFNSKKAEFNDRQKAHTQFWNRYDRPPKREYWDYIVDRRDLLVSQDVRERKGSFYTPSRWVELSQQYIAAELGENWQDDYYVWDCCAGTGNLLAGLTNKHHIWASTLDQADVDVMHDRINTMNEASSNGINGANLLHDHVFQFDFLNDSIDKLPKSLRDVIEDKEKLKKLVIYINPPYAEASNARTVTGSGQNRAGLSKSAVLERWKEDREFQGDCLAFTLFHGQNRISSQHGKNHFIPFTEQEVDARDNFSSHFMSDLILGRLKEDTAKPAMQDLFMATEPLHRYDEPIAFSEEAQRVMDAGRELWRYYHKQEDAVPDSSYYDIRLHFQGTRTTPGGKIQMNSDSSDVRYNELIAELKSRQKALASKIAERVYEYGFLKK